MLEQLKTDARVKKALDGLYFGRQPFRLYANGSFCPPSNSVTEIIPRPPALMPLNPYF